MVDILKAGSKGPSMLNRVIFAGGGTGGHNYMAVALAEELKKHNPDAQILFVGTRTGLESNVLPTKEISLENICIGGLKNVGILKTLRTLLQLPGSLLQSRKIVKRFSPSLVVGLGGYSSGPVVLASKCLGFPALLIEPNIQPGFTNRLLLHWADGAAVAYQETFAKFGSKCRVTGIPIRPAFHKINSKISRKGPLRILIFGGSRGSRAINNLVCEALPFLSSDCVSIVHQTGPYDYSKVKENFRQTNIEVEPIKFIQDMPKRFSDTDLIIARSGALTLAEITASGRASILIPFPQATDNHQIKNAKTLSDRRAALVLIEENTNGRKLAHLIMELEKNRERLISMARSAKVLAQPESVHKIIKFMQELC